MYNVNTVLQDVVNALFGQAFVAELFRAQPIHSNTEIHELFRKLAHSSIMRLNDSSMSKVCSNFNIHVYTHIPHLPSLFLSLSFSRSLALCKDDIMFRCKKSVECVYNLFIYILCILYVVV